MPRKRVGRPKKVGGRKRGSSLLKKLLAAAKPLAQKKKRVARKKVGGRRKRGGSFFGDLWDGIKSVAAPVHKFVKDNKLISKGLALVPGAYSKAGSAAADALGYGKRKRGGAKPKFS